MTRLDVSSRTPDGSRAARRMRHGGVVPGILYGHGDSVSFAVEARALRNALAAAGAVLEVSLDGGSPTPAVLKVAQRHPVRGDTIHVDLIRVRLDEAIQAAVAIELIGGEEAPGVREGGVLEHVSHTIMVEALPTSIPESISYDVSAMVIGDTVVASALLAPEGVTLLGELDEIVIATLSRRVFASRRRRSSRRPGSSAKAKTRRARARPQRRARQRIRLPSPAQTTASRPCASHAAPRSTGSSSALATPAASTRAPDTTSASRLPRSSRGAGISVVSARATAVCCVRVGPVAAPHASRCSSHRRT